MVLIIIIGAAVLIFFLIIITINNSLISNKNEVNNTFGGMDVQLKKRYDLIPNLISTVKEYMEHEKSILEDITRLRTQAVSGKLSDNEKVDVDNKISKAMNGIMVAVENYPDLKASEGFSNLQKMLNEVESQISAARRTYNAAVTSYNNGVEMFPSSIIANMKNYKTKTVFEIPDSERKNVQVGNLFK